MDFRKKILIFVGMICFMSVCILGAMHYVNAEQSETTEKNVKIKSSPIQSGTMEALSNRQVHPFKEDQLENQFDLDGFTKIAQSESSELWLNETWNTLRIKNKKTGYIWGGTAVEGAEGLSKSWNNYSNSIVAIECFDESGMQKRYSLTSDANTTYHIKENGFTLFADFSEIGISFETEVVFENNKLSFSVKEESITEGTNEQTFRLATMIFLPFLGASHSDEVDGYMLIPDGSGALIRFQKPAQYSSTFAAKVYGKDLGIETLLVPSDLNAHRPNDYMVQEPQILMPIYGVVHGAYQNGFLSVIERGAEYASIMATPAITNNPYNWAAACFEFRQKYVKNISRKEGAGAVVPQEHRNEISPALSIYILDGKEAHYDGMAVFYRDLLNSQNELKEVSMDNEKFPIRIEVLGGDLREEFIGKSFQLFTNTKEASQIVERLWNKGMTNLSFIYKGYTKNNEAGRAFISKVGNKSDFYKLEEQVEREGGRFYYYLNPLSANVDQINKRKEAANNLSNMVIKLNRSNKALMYQDTFFYRLSEVERRIEKVLENKGYGDSTQFAVDELSYRLFGDFTSKRESTRGENLEYTMKLIEKTAGNKAIPMYTPNQYLWKYTSEFYNVPLSGGQFLYETDTVPFIQIVLSGSIPMFGLPLNTGTYSTERLLRHIEYGVAPSFIVNACDSIALYKTAQEDYFSTNFDDWEEFLHEAYDFISKALQPVQGQAIIEHKAIEDGFICVTYENGTKVYVNYTDVQKSDGNVTVNPNWYSVVE